MVFFVPKAPKARGSLTVGFKRFKTLISVHLTCELNYQGVDGISISELKSAVVSEVCVQFTLTSHKQFVTGQQPDKGMKSMKAT